ncbi:MAG: YceI family protein [Bacteroidota bacterium]
MSEKLALVLLFWGLLSLPLAAQQQSYTLAEESSVSVVGTSTMHDWTATSTDIRDEVKLKASLSSLNESLMGSSIGSVSLRIPVKSLDGGRGNIMNDKIRKALKASAYPDILYSMTTGNLGDISPGETGLFSIETMGSLAIAGVEKKVMIQVSGRLMDNKGYFFEGQYKTKMTDFDIEPPSALFGQIQTDDEIIIKFSLTLYPEN